MQACFLQDGVHAETNSRCGWGISDFSTTANIYAHIDVDSKMEAANMIASKINLGELPEKKKSPKRKIA